MERRCYNCMKNFYIPEGHEDEDNVCPYCGFIENTTPENVCYLRTGVTLKGRYTIGTVIGAGGFGITYKAWDNTLETIVAIKEFFPQGVVLRDNTTSKTNTVSVYNVRDDSYEHGKQRFIKEARSLANFNSHPGTVAIYDFFEENDTAYIVMEYLDGCNMKEYVAATQSLPPMNILTGMIATVCDVLTEVHSVGLIHRDISPDNIFMCLNGTFKLIDFGSVKQGLSNSNLSSTVILKHGYAPIEQYTKSGKVGPWTDIYSLAATIYMLSTGVMPQESVERMTDDEVEDICKLNSRLPRSFGDAVMKGMSVHMRDRYQSVEEFRRDLFTDFEMPPVKKKVENIEPEPVYAEKKVETIELEPVHVEEKAEVPEEIADTSKEAYTKDSKIKSFFGFLKTPLGRIAITLFAMIMIGVLAFVFDSDEETDEQNRVKTTTEEKAEATAETKAELTTEKKAEATTEEPTESTTEKAVDNSYETVIFGNYWHDYSKNGVLVLDDGSYVVPGETDEKTPIEWRVLKKNDDGTAIVISEKIIDCRPFNTDETPVRWSDCSLRKWLNEYFYNEAFSDDEKSAIVTMTLKDYSVGASDTEDNVYLLSYSELKNKAYGLSDRKAVGTDYAIQNGLTQAEEKGEDVGMWWLRSSGAVDAFLSNAANNDTSKAQIVTTTGGVSKGGRPITEDYIGVRPVICLNLTSNLVIKTD